MVCSESQAAPQSAKAFCGKNATIEALVGRGGKHKLRLFTPHERGLSQTPSCYFMDAFAKFAKVCLFFC